MGLHVFCFGRDVEGGAKLCAQCTYPQGVSRDALEPPNILMGQQGAPAGIPVDGRQDNEAKKIAHGKVNFPGQPTLASPLCIDGDDDIDVTVGMFEFNGHRYMIDLSRAPNLAAVCNKNKEARCAYAC
jgi:hypothetical protein